MDNSTHCIPVENDDITMEDKESAVVQERGDEPEEQLLSLLPTKILTFSSMLPHHGFLQGMRQVHEPSPDAPVHWKAMSVVEWVESLAAATEVSEQRKSSEQRSSRHLFSNAEYQPYPSISMSATVPDQLRLGPIVLSEPSVSPPAAPWTLKKTASPEVIAMKTEADTFPSMPLVMPRSWDMSRVHSIDCFAWIYTGEILTLAVEFERLVDQLSSTNTSSLWQSYDMLHHRLDYLVSKIAKQYSFASTLQGGEPRELLNHLYSDTTTKLMDLIETARFEIKRVPDSDSDSAPLSPGSTASSSEQPKKELSAYMMEWLRRNWTNPYPDENGLQEMARECDTTTTVVSNWLINARTRKWRPAIVKASALNRPADCLLPDSLRLFMGEKTLVRALKSPKKRNKSNHHS